MNVDFTNEHLSILNDSQESSNVMGISDDSQVSISLHSQSTLPIGGSGTILSDNPSQSVLAQEPTMPKRPHNVNISKQFIACLNMQNRTTIEKFIITFQFIIGILLLLPRPSIKRSKGKKLRYEFKVIRIILQ